MKSLGDQSFACATSQADKPQFAFVGNYSYDILAAAINIGKVDDLVSFTKGAFLVSSKISKSKETQQRLYGDQLDPQRIPVFGKTLYGVTFSGKQFEIVDHFGKAALPCYLNSRQAIKLGINTQEPIVASLPSKYLPPHVTDYLNEDISFLNRFFFDSRPQSNGYHTNFQAECTDQGKILIKSSNRTCQPNKKIYLGKNCYNSFSTILRDQHLSNKNEKSKNSINLNAMAAHYCKEINKNYNNWKSNRKLIIQADHICADETCHFKFLDKEYNYKFGDCSQIGSICLPTPSGPHLFEDLSFLTFEGNGLHQCSRHMDQKKRINKCFSYEGEEVQEGQCFTPAYFRNSSLNYSSYTNGRRYLNVDFQDAAYLALTRVPSFLCIKDSAGRSSVEFDNKCCTDNGGLVVHGIDFKNEGMDYRSDQEAHETWILKSLQTLTLCHKKDDFSFKAWGIGLGLDKNNEGASLKQEK